jgi:hypothetical protein
MKGGDRMKAKGKYLLVSPTTGMRLWFIPKGFGAVLMHWVDLGMKQTVHETDARLMWKGLVLAGGWKRVA